MAPRSRTTTPSLGVRLTTLVVVPAIALGILGFERISTERATAEEAAALADAADFQRQIAEVYPSAQLIQIALEGLARVDELGLPRELVETISGIDFVELFAENTQRFDDSVDRLTTQRGDVLLADGTTVGERLIELHSDIDALTDALEARERLSLDEVQDTFERLNGTLEELLDLTTADSGLAGNRRAQLDTLASVLTSAGERARTMIRGLLYRTPELTAEANRLTVWHRAYLDAHRTSLPEESRQSVDDMMAEEEALPVLVSDPDEPEPQITASFVDQAAEAVLRHVVYLQDLATYSGELHDEITAEATAFAEAARSDARRTTVLLIGIFLISIALIGAVLWSILVPLRRLTRRAAAVGRGELQHDPLPESGPGAVRSLSTTMNELVVTLDRVRTEMALLASGEAGDDAARPELPGAIGIAMRGSVERLADVTARLQRSEQFASAIVDEAADAIWTVDEAGQVRSANAAAARLHGLPVADQVGRPIHDLLPSTHGEVHLVRPSGEQLHALVVSSTVEVDDERFTVVIAHDISERSQFEERLAYQASHDALTGLPNRFSLLAHLEDRLRGEERVHVLFVDLDGFKNVNDTQGHAVGDQVLEGVADRLVRCVREGDFIGRLGGDEFVIVSRDDGQAEAASHFGERVIRELERPLDVGGRTFSLSASVGVAVPPPHTSALDVIRQADNAVYQAKHRGRGRVEIYDESMQDRVAHEAGLELELRGAVRDDQLLLHLQPVFDLVDDRIVGAEALVRWDRPDHGILLPGDFIGIAERSSLVFEIERWVLRESCRRLVAWRRSDPDCALRIAVNVSGRHLIDGDLVGDVRAVLDETGAPPELLELELTETQMLADVDRAIAVLEELRSWGITIAVDDFGTGYSSLTYLRNLPLDTVKIDRSFVEQAIGHAYDSTVIDALLTISRSLDLTVVAEGVETVEQLEFLRERRCHRAQGFLLARPMPIAQVEALLFDATRATIPTAVSATSPA